VKVVARLGRKIPFHFPSEELRQSLTSVRIAEGADIAEPIVVDGEAENRAEVSSSQNDSEPSQRRETLSWSHWKNLQGSWVCAFLEKKFGVR
jgi:hypothetical protein